MQADATGGALPGAKPNHGNHMRWQTGKVTIAERNAELRLYITQTVVSRELLHLHQPSSFSTATAHPAVISTSGMIDLFCTDHVK